jgi:ferredoxin
MPVSAIQRRLSSFDEVELEISREAALLEVKRCLQCGYSEVDSGRCIGCGACRAVCPRGDVIAMKKIEEGGGNV